MKPISLPKTILFSIGILTFIFIHNAQASEIRVATDVESQISEPDAHFSKNMWIFTKPDESGISQVYYQWVDSSTTATATSEAVQLTHNTVDASDAKFGSDVQALGYAETYGGTNTDCNGSLFFYLADVNADSRTEIRMGCIQAASVMTSSPDIAFDIAITGYSRATNFNVKSYDVARTSSPTTAIYYGTSGFVDSYPVVFTDTANQLHMLMFSKDQVYADNSNIRGSYPVMVYDYTDTVGLYVWDSAAINAVNRYFTPKLDSWANNIIYSFKPAPGSKKQLGTISIMGVRQFQITNFSRDVLNPSYHGNGYPSSDSLGKMGIHVFFELAATPSKSKQIAYVPVGYSYGGTLAWCNTAALLTDAATDRGDLQTSYGSNPYDITAKTLMVYERANSDGKSDLYLSIADLEPAAGSFYCGGTLTRSDGTVMELDFTGTAISKFYDLSASLSTERQLTCMNNNTAAAFLPSVFHDADFNITTSAEDGVDIVLHRDLSDGSGDVLVHLYDADTATDECADTCYETADGTPIVDANAITDGDGIADSCESTECADIIESDFYGDADADSVINHLDNCPCDYNPDQADSDADDWGDACDIEEDECGTVDTDGDGTFDTCDQCPNNADYTALAFDIDGDGINDSCVEATSECGSEDADSDGIMDGCDSCVNGYVPGTGVFTRSGALGSVLTSGTRCEVEEEDVNECGSVDTDGDGTFDNCDACPNDNTLTVLAYDLDGDGNNDSCAADINDCGEEDSDGDGTNDKCDACPDDSAATALIYDIDGDGTKDSCVQAKESTLKSNSGDTDPPSFNGGFMASGGLVSCALNENAVSDPSTQALPALGLGLTLLGLMAQRYKKRQKC